jgi:NAD(P)-dependent dehydrogenase (short-subunit alcohol dehydrogenase family)
MARNRFEGKVAVVTGGNSGIGLAVAKAFAAEGAKVAVTGRDEKTLREAERQIGAGTLALRADVSRPDELDRAFGEIKQRLGRVDALFVNAGIGKFVPFDQVTEQILGFP